MIRQVEKNESSHVPEFTDITIPTLVIFMKFLPLVILKITTIFKELLYFSSKVWHPGQLLSVGDVQLKKWNGSINLHECYFTVAIVVLTALNTYNIVFLCNPARL